MNDKLKGKIKVSAFIYITTVICPWDSMPSANMYCIYFLLFSALWKLAHYVIMPDSRLAMICERLVLSVLLIICFVYTFVASFSISLQAIGYGESIGSTVLLVITYFLDAVLVGDFIMRFNLASETTTGNCIALQLRHWQNMWTSRLQIYCVTMGILNR